MRPRRPHVSALAFLALALGLGTLRPARAEGVRFEARASSENVTIDQTVDLVITLERDGNQVFESYRPPLAPDFDLLHTGTSQQMQMSLVNGRQSVRMVEQHQYVFRPKKKGALTIGAASVRVAGQALQTRAIVIRVAAAPKNAMSTVQPAPGGAAGIGVPGAPAPAPESLRGDEDLFLDARFDKPKVYVGEQVTATWSLYTQSDILKYRSVAEPKHEDFWSEDLFVPGGHLAWDRQQVKGQDYAVAMLLKKALFPLKPGRLTVTALESEATTLQSAFYSGASAVRRSAPLSVEVVPLPADGRPAGFLPAQVGRYTLDASVDRAAVKAGEAVSLRIALTGEGNLRQVALPPLERVDGFKVYQPVVREHVERGEPVRGEKVYTYLLMPERGGTLSIPAVSFPFFDPQAGRYEVARTAPISITVEGDPSKVQETSGTAAAQENVLGAQIRPLRNRGSARGHLGEHLFRSRFAAALLAGPPASWILVLVGDAIRRRLARETERVRRRRARRGARQRMRVADYHIKAQRPSAFFGECTRALYEHLEFRLGQKVESLTLAELRAHLDQRGFEPEVAEAVVKELETCDFARFAPSASGPGEMRAALRRVRDLLEEIERARMAKEAA